MRFCSKEIEKDVIELLQLMDIDIRKLEVSSKKNGHTEDNPQCFDIDFYYENINFYRLRKVPDSRVFRYENTCEYEILERIASALDNFFKIEEGFACVFWKRYILEVEV
jgi:hypothetical protein